MALGRSRGRNGGVRMLRRTEWMGVCDIHERQHSLAVRFFVVFAARSRYEQHAYTAHGRLPSRMVGTC